MRTIVNYLRRNALDLLPILAIAGLLLNLAQAEERFITVASSSLSFNSSR